MKHLQRTITGTAALLVMLLCSCARSPEARRDAHLATGKQLLAKKDYSRALLEFRNAAQAMPKDPSPYCQMGIAYGMLQDYVSAVKAFQKALSLDPKHAESQLRMAQLLALTNDSGLLQDARDRLNKALESGPSVEALNALAFTELKLGNPENAEQGLLRALKQSPTELSSTVMLAWTRFSQKDVKGAEELLVKACNDLPKSAEARRLLGDFYVGQRRIAEAESKFREALQIDPVNAPALLNLALLELKGGNKQQAEQHFRQLAALPGHKAIYAIFLFQEGRRDEALREFETLARQDPDDRQARTNLIAAYQYFGRMADADRILDAAIKKNATDADALLQRGETYIRAGKYVDAEQDLNRVLQLRPNAPQVHYVLAKLNQAKGLTMRYRQELIEALRLNPELHAVRVELAQNLNNSKEPRAALNVLKEAPGVHKLLPSLLVQQNWAHWALGDLATMRKGIDSGLAQTRSADLLVQDGLWKLSSGNVAGARAVLEEALNLNPADLRALQVISLTYRGKEASMAVQKVKEYALRQPKLAPVQHFLGTMLTAQGDRSGARTAFEAAKSADPQFTAAEFSLAQLDVADGKLADARKRLDKILAANSRNTTARLWVATLDLIGGQVTTGAESPTADNLRKVLAQDPRNAQALNNLAYLLAEGGVKLDEALQYAEKAVEIAPEQPEYCDTLGWVLYRKGVYRSAIKYLERASTGNNDPISRYHLAMAYAKAGDLRRSKSVLQTALKMNPKLPEAKIAQELVAASQ